MWIQSLPAPCGMASIPQGGSAPTSDPAWPPATEGKVTIDLFPFTIFSFIIIKIPLNLNIIYKIKSSTLFNNKLIIKLNFNIFYFRF